MDASWCVDDSWCKCKRRLREARVSEQRHNRRGPHADLKMSRLARTSHFHTCTQLSGVFIPSFTGCFVAVLVVLATYVAWGVTDRRRASSSRSAAPAAAVHAAARHQRPLRPLPMAETGLWGPCVLPTHVRSTAASTVDADIMLSMTSAVARHRISPRCWCAPTAGLVQLVARRPQSVDGTECGRCESGCTGPAVGAYQHRSACSAHGTLTQAPRGVVPEAGTRATGRVLRSAGHGH